MEEAKKMSYPLWDLAGDLAVARGGNGPEKDPEIDPRYLRGRIAGVLWIPGVVLSIVVGEATGIMALGIAAFIVLVAGLAVLVVGPRRLLALVRRR